MAVENNKLVYICSPYKGCIIKRIRNVAYAKKLTREAVEMGLTPITPHLYLTRVYKDRKAKERVTGTRTGLDLLSYCGQILVGTKYGLSKGMIKELDLAEELNIPYISSGSNKTLSKQEMDKRNLEVEAMRRQELEKEKKRGLRRLHIRQFKMYCRITVRHLKAIFKGNM